MELQEARAVLRIGEGASLEATRSAWVAHRLSREALRFHFDPEVRAFAEREIASARRAFELIEQAHRAAVVAAGPRPVGNRPAFEAELLRARQEDRRQGRWIVLAAVVIGLGAILSWLVTRAGVLDGERIASAMLPILLATFVLLFAALAISGRSSARAFERLRAIDLRCSLCGAHAVEAWPARETLVELEGPCVCCRG